MRYAAVAALAIAVRLPNVWRAALSQDEVFSARIIREPTVTAAVRHVVRTESTPPLWYMLGWLAHHAGVPVVDVRLLSVAFGGALAAVVLALASLVLPRGFALVAALLAAVAYQPVVHGSELRSYELLALLAATFALLLLRRANAVAVGALVWAGLLTHYFFAFTVAAALAWVWLDPAARDYRRRATLAIAAGGACAAPWLPGFVAQYGHDHYWWIERFTVNAVAVTPLSTFSPLGHRHLVAGLLVLTVLTAGGFTLRRSPAGRATVLFGFAPIATAAALWAGGMRIYAVRNLIETAPFLAIAAAAALAALPRRVAVPAAAAAVAAAGAVWLSVAALPPPQYQAIARALVAAGWRPSDPIAVFGNFFAFRAPLEWYLPHNPLLDVSSPARGTCPALFVVAPRRNGSFDVDRVARASPARLRHATLLAAMRGAAPCVRLSRNPRLEPLT